MKPERVTTRVTTKDFFAMFDVPFQYGGTWTDCGRHRPRAGHGPVAQGERQAVRRREQRRPRRSAGTTTSSASSACSTTGCRCRRSTTSTTARSRSPRTSTSPSAGAPRSSCRAPGNTNCWKPEDIKTYQAVPELRVRLDPDVGRAAGRGRARPLPDLPRQLRAASRRQAGRYPRPLNNRLTKVGPVAGRQRSGQQRQPRARRPRVRLPRGVPDQHRGPAAREVPERRPDHRRAPRARREPARRSSCSTWSRSASISLDRRGARPRARRAGARGPARAVHGRSDRSPAARRRSRTWT